MALDEGEPASIQAFGSVPARVSYPQLIDFGAQERQRTIVNQITGSGRYLPVLILLIASATSWAVGCQSETDSFKPASLSLVTDEEVMKSGMVDTERGVIEIYDAAGKLDEDGIVWLDVSYRFTSGEPVKLYLCNVTFPGTDQVGLKPLQTFEVAAEGKFSTGIEVGDTQVTDFEITLSEADSPDRGYHLISNTFKGRIQQSE